MAQRHDDVPRADEDHPGAITDEERIAAAVAEGDPAADDLLPPDEEAFVDGTTGRSDLAAERDEYLEALQRVKAEFDNYKKRTSRERTELADRANARLAEALLPVLDACDAAVAHGLDDVDPIYKTLLEVLEKQGLERMEPIGEAFDPNLHQAVMHEPGDEGEALVAEMLRTGYLWKAQVLRPAMVKVKG